MAVNPYLYGTSHLEKLYRRKAPSARRYTDPYNLLMSREQVREDKEYRDAMLSLQRKGQSDARQEAEKDLATARKNAEDAEELGEASLYIGGAGLALSAAQLAHSLWGGAAGTATTTAPASTTVLYGATPDKMTLVGSAATPTTAASTGASGTAASTGTSGTAASTGAGLSSLAALVPAALYLGADYYTRATDKPGYNWETQLDLYQQTGYFYHPEDGRLYKPEPSEIANLQRGFQQYGENVLYSQAFGITPNRGYTGPNVAPNYVDSMWLEENPLPKLSSQGQALIDNARAQGIANINVSDYPEEVLSSLFERPTTPGHRGEEPVSQKFPWEQYLPGTREYNLSKMGYTLPAVIDSPP